MLVLLVALVWSSESYRSLKKRARTILVCPGNLPSINRFPPGYDPSDFKYGLFQLCYDAGCDCGKGYSACELDDDSGTDPSLYHTFAEECLQVCSCQDLDSRPWVGDKENVGTGFVPNAGNNWADSVPGAGYTKDMECATGQGEAQFCKQGKDVCCKGFECIGHLQQAARVLFGLEALMEIGTCQLATL
ncbi:MAG: hypothetical protein M1812_005395 [Candelaria pacifica]|nr:MAG: hypothetical protein M1812_005395 [Candelaria pacifica]